MSAKLLSTDMLDSLISAVWLSTRGWQRSDLHENYFDGVQFLFNAIGAESHTRPHRLFLI